ncbi:MAG: hypothetical protein ACJ8AT_06430 [Hyalangium sp.]|uniref:hypothetical protein n=1 Tax=Hyalangium sp. TaxID=2028555 RepID=UPI00389B0464
MRLKNLSAFLLLVLGGCSGAEFTEPPMPPPSRDERLEDDTGVREPVATEAARGDRPPVARLRSPEEGARYRPGSALTFEGRGEDPEDGALPASAFTWWVDIHRGDRVSSFVPPLSGMARGTFTVPAMQETDGPQWYRIHLEVRDSHGNTHAVYRDVYAEDVKSDELSPRVR